MKIRQRKYTPEQQILYKAILNYLRYYIVNMEVKNESVISYKNKWRISKYINSEYDLTYIYIVTMSNTPIDTVYIQLLPTNSSEIKNIIYNILG